MNVARTTSAIRAHTTGGRRRWWLIAMIGLLSCSPRSPVLVPEVPMNYIIPPDMPDEDRVCVVIPAGPPYDPALVGIHCMTVKDLRLWFGRQQRAE